MTSPTTDYKGEIRRLVVTISRDDNATFYPKGYVSKLLALLDRAIVNELESLKQFNGAYTGIDGKRVDNMVAHQVIDERIAGRLPNKANEGEQPLDEYICPACGAKGGMHVKGAPHPESIYGKVRNRDEENVTAPPEQGAEGK